MPKGKSKKSKLEFSQKLVLNQWLISLFGVDPLAYGYKRGEKPFHKLAEHLRVTREGLDADGLHHFYHKLKDGDFFRMGMAKVSAAELQRYEENIVSHTAAINLGRAADRQIKRKYFQWLSLHPAVRARRSAKGLGVELEAQQSFERASSSSVHARS